MLPIQTILFPTDFSRQSEYAYHLACALARDYGAKLLIVHVQAPPVVMGEALPESPSPEAIKKQLKELYPTEDSIVVERLVFEGDAVAEIVRHAAEFRADLVVMGTHGRSGLTRLLVGSVAEGVLRKAACPVLTIKAPALEAEAKKTPEKRARAKSSK